MFDYKECGPCFLRQGQQMAQLASKEAKVQQAIFHKVKALSRRLREGITPPEVASDIQAAVQKIVGPRDFYAEIKKISNKKALALYPKLKKRVDDADDRLLEAVKIAISGNIIDYGAKSVLDVDAEIEKFFHDESQVTEDNIPHYQDFRRDLLTVPRILYLADNAGEIVFDKILIEEIKALGKEVVVAVRGSAIINDATVEDARDCAVDVVARVITNGSDIPGTVLEKTSRDFQRIFHQAPLIISKGQGNYETLYHQKTPLIYFFFKVKCAMVAYLAQARIGDVALRTNRS